MADKYRFAIDRGGTFTDIYAECPGGIHLLSYNLRSPSPPPFQIFHFKNVQSNAVRFLHFRC